MPDILTQSQQGSDTQTFLKVEPNSTIFGVSIRAWITVVVVLTICGSYLATVVGVVVHAVITKDWALVGTFATVGEPLYSLSAITVGFYFGQKSQTK
jgi:hypothetical protein